MKSCEFKSKKASVISWFQSQGLIDRDMNVLDINKFNEANRNWSDYAEYNLDTTETLFRVEEGKAIPNDQVFRKLDGEVEPSNIVLTEQVEPLNIYQQLTAYSSRKISPELYNHLESYLKAINPDFRVEILENLSYNGATKLGQALIELKQGEEFTAMPEEVAHVFVELSNDKLKQSLFEEITRTKIYKRVLDEYSNNPEYRNENGTPNYKKLKAEASAKLISLYLQDKDAFEYWSGSKDLVSRLRSILDRFIRWMKGLPNPFSYSAIQILQGNVSDLSKELNDTSGVYYQLRDYTHFQTLGDDITKYDRIYINLNNTLLDYANYKADKQVKTQMFTNLNFRSDLNRFYREAGLTKLGRELKDKMHIVNPNRVIVFTDMPVTSELLNRIRDEFGNVNVVPTGFETVKTIYDDFGNPVDRLTIGSEKVNWMNNQSRLYPNGKLLFIDNQATQIFEGTLPNVTPLYYADKSASYTDYETQRRKDEQNQKAKEFTQAVIDELESTNKESLIPLVKQSLNIVRTVINRLENEQNKELTETFKDEYGNLNVPVEQARIINRLLEDTDKFEQAILHFIQTIESTRLFFSKANELDFRGLKDKGLRDLAESDNSEDIERSIREAAIIMRNILSWEEWLGEIRPHIQNTKFIRKVIGDFETELSTSKDKVNEIAVTLLSKNLEGEWKAYNQGVESKFKQGVITREERDNQMITAQEIADWLYGRGGDISKLAYFENPLFIGDKVMSAISKKLEIITQSADEQSLKESTNLSKELWDLGEKIGKSDIEIGKLITYIDQETYWEDGEMKTRDVKMFLNKFKNLYKYNIERQKFLDARDKWIEAKANNNITTELDDYLEAKKNWDTWVEQNWYDTFTWEGKHIYELIPGLVDRDFEEALEIQRDLYKELREWEEQLRFPILSEEAEDNINHEIERVLREIRLLRNEYNEDGNLKQGKELVIAQKLKEKSKIDRQIYESELDKKKFLNAVKEQIASVSDETVQETLLTLLNTENLSELYDFAKLNAPQIFVDWLDRNTRIKFSDNFYEIRSELFDRLEQILPESDEYKELKVELRQTWDELKNITSYLRDADFVLDASDSSPLMQERVKEFELVIEELKKLLGQNNINPEAQFILQQLSELQGRNSTGYYSQVMYDKLVSLYSVGMSDSTDFLDLINTEPFQKWLKKADKTKEEQEFFEWFWRNHLVKTSRGETFITPTYIWMKIEPKNKEDILIIPSWKYNTRQIKDNVNLEYEIDGERKEKFVQIKTQKNDITWDETFRRWNPKSKQFINEDYDRLRRSDPLVFEYLDKLTTFFKEKQRGVNRESQQGLKVPTLHKRYEEGQFLKTAWKAFTYKLNPREEGEANLGQKSKTFKQRLEGILGVPSEEVKQVRTDYLGNKIRQIFTPFTSYLEPDNVTDDTLLAVIQYTHGLERVKSLTQNLPKLNLLEQVFQQFQPQAKKTVNQYGQTIPAGTNNRLVLLQHLEKTKLYGEFKEFEMSPEIDRLLLSMRKITTIGSQSVLNLPNAVKNWLQGTLMNLILAGSYNWNSRKSVLKAIRDPKVSFGYILTEMPKKEKGLDFYIQTFFNPALERNINQYFKRGAVGIMGQEDNILLSAKYSEYGPANILLYSHLYHQEVDYQGAKVKLKDVLEVRDGGLAVKEGATIDGQPIDLQEIKLKFKTLAEEVLGKQWNQTIAQRYTLWQAIEFFKRFFIPGIRKRFSPKRINPVLGETEGYYITAFRVILGLLYKHLYNSQFDITLSKEEKIRLNQARDEFLLMVATFAIIAIGFGFDNDDKDRYQKLKDKSWLENMLLLIAINTKRETDSLTPFPFLTINQSIVPPVANETLQYIKEPFIGFNALTDAKKLLDATLALSFGLEGARYDKNMPQFFIDKGDSKLEHYLWKLSNFDEFLYQSDPRKKIQIVANFGNK